MPTANMGLQVMAGVGLKSQHGLGFHYALDADHLSGHQAGKVIGGLDPYNRDQIIFAAD